MGASAVRQFHREEDVAGFHGSHLRSPKTISDEISKEYTSSSVDYTPVRLKVKPEPQSGVAAHGENLQRSMRRLHSPPHLVR
jgi:hypothetical protein